MNFLNGGAIILNYLEYAHFEGIIKKKICSVRVMFRKLLINKLKYLLKNV